MGLISDSTCLWLMLQSVDFAGDYKVFQDDAVFWVTFCCIALIIPIVFVGCPRMVSIPGVFSFAGVQFWSSGVALVSTFFGCSISLSCLPLAPNVLEKVLLHVDARTPRAELLRLCRC